PKLRLSTVELAIDGELVFVGLDHIDGVLLTLQVIQLDTAGFPRVADSGLHGVVQLVYRLAVVAVQILKGVPVLDLGTHIRHTVAVRVTEQDVIATIDPRQSGRVLTSEGALESEV